MLKGRGRDPRVAASPTPAHLVGRSPAQVHPGARPAHSPTHLNLRTPTQPRAPLARPEPDYEVVEFPSDQYVNAKLQPPPPPPPRPPTGHPAEAASCGLCGGGGARVRCTECGRRALCASCDDMYHRHPKRRHHQRQALSPNQVRDERPPLPPKGTPPVPPPRRHKMGGDRMSASPRPPSAEPRNSMQSHPVMHTQTMPLNNRMTHAQVPAHLQGKFPAAPAAHLGSMPYLPAQHAHALAQANTMGHLVPTGWQRPRGSLPGFNVPPNVPMAHDTWDGSENMGAQSWGRPLRRGASVLELGGGVPVCGAGGACTGCGQCAPGWRYGSCASLDHQPWAGAWGGPACCHPPLHAHAPMHAHAHPHAPYTPQPYRRADSRAASRCGSRAASPAASVRSRASRRVRQRSPSPPPLPSSDADSESESDTDRRGPIKEAPASKPPEPEEEWLGPPPAAPQAAWQCEHCTFVNEPGVRVCAVCCRTPTAPPRVVAPVAASTKTTNDSPSVADSARSVAESARGMARLGLGERAPAPAAAGARVQQNGGSKTKTASKKERVSTGCGPSPPREDSSKRQISRLVTPTREQSVEPQQRHDMGVGSSPPREVSSMGVGTSPPRQNTLVGARQPEPERHSVSVGPSPPREIRATPVQKFADDVLDSRSSSTSLRANVSTTGTSPPPQTISTQTYEVPPTWARSEAARSRPRRRFRDDARRERSHSRHSLSSDTRESERSARTSGGGGGGGGSSGRWEWRESRDARDGRDSSPGGEWSGSERRHAPRLARRASHLDLRRERPAPPRRAHAYRSEAASPEPTRAMSLEALAGRGADAAAERGLELARLMADAERLGFSAAEVQAALAQSPAAPLSWLRERWPSLCAGVRAAAARLAPRAAVTDLEARAALARHRGAMWPAVTECVARHRQGDTLTSTEGRMRGRVWGSPAGADDDAAPPRRLRAEDSSDEFDDAPPARLRDDDWMYLPLDVGPKGRRLSDPRDTWGARPTPVDAVATEVALELSRLLAEAGVPTVNEDLLLNDLLSTPPVVNTPIVNPKPNSMEFIQSENDFIDAYNALTRFTPLPSVDNQSDTTHPLPESDPKRDTYDVIENNSNSNHQHVTNASPINSLPGNHISERITNSQKVQNNTLTNIIPNEHFEAIYHSDNTQNNTETSSRHNSVTRGEAIPDLSTEFSNLQVNATEEILDTNAEHEQTPTKTLNKDPIGKEITTTVEESATDDTTLENNSENSQSDNQSTEKTSNLNDIVDNTQKLIQLMKDEINSDINSIDDRNMSQSEADSTSESDLSSEHESSYSDTEDKETDELSSNETETSSTASGQEHGQERRPTIIQRTSSEENDQFEEAMDHIEDQIEDFKNTNIDILDSIARSLQEEHTISVQVTQPIIPNNRRPDLNNNLFVEVNSFEEIYDELNTNKKETSNQPRTNKTLNGKSENNFQNQIVQKYNFTKQLIKTSAFEAGLPIKLVFTENNHNALNAIIEDIEYNFVAHEDLLTNGEPANAENEILENENLVTAEEEIITNIDPINREEIIQSVDVGYGENTVVTANQNNTNALTSNNVAHDNNNLVTMNQNNATEVRSSSEEDKLSASDKSEIITQTSQRNLIISDRPAVENNSEQENIVENGAQTINLDINIHEHSENVNVAENFTNDITENTRKNDIPNHVVVSERNETPEKSPPNSPSANNTNKSFSLNKSNIPKLVKVITNNKQKTDKTSPKVIGSKVPVRRASIKQHPAPTPPKTHFGNVQSGHVKQLQTRLFNNKFPKTVVNVPDVVDVKPSTSTMHKKKPAPPPPVNQKRVSPSKASPPKEKKSNYFRETCRTEDEWTESESEELPSRAGREESPARPPSPPPPVTVRCVAGQIIDLAKVRLPEGSPERQARMLLAEGACETWEQARLGVELVARGAEVGAALLAALQCADLAAARAYLQQDCELCAERLPEHEMVSMLRCTHRCCRSCARLYFTVQVSERSIADCVCPYCKLPALEELPEDEWLEYFAHLDILLKTLLDADVHELFQRKLRDRTLARDPNFRWCVECSSGFFVHPKQKKIRCPECRSVSCAKCRKGWSANHEGVSCEQYAAWLEDNDPERSLAAVKQHLQENGLECPRCHFKYSLSRGGCMHFTCTQCKYEFCYGCGKAFTMGARCGLSEYCARLGLHAHHPRNCLFYLRDKEPHELQTLLQMNNVPYETAGAESSNNRCPIQLQRETPAGLVDGICAGDTPPNYAGLCKNHYLEYLSRLVRARAVDPLPLLAVDDLETLVRRAALRPPPRPYGSLHGLYARALAEIVKEKIPLE